MMKTPICDFVKKYAASDALRLHMPGHKGASVLGCEKLDITEIDGADVLYSASGIIKESETNAASLFGASLTKYSTEGSSLSIRAMLYLAVVAARSEGKRPTIAVGRNAHKAFMTAAALLDFEIMWLYGDSNDVISCRITAKALEAVFSGTNKPAAVYITSPDYLGNVADIKSLAEVCHRHGALLLVDNAHGAYLGFLEENRHPITLGADICCDSAHKTLPVLTGGAYLHVSEGAPALCREMAESAMSMFASTSPSYLIMQSLDAANKHLSGDYRAHLSDSVRKLAELKKRLLDHGYRLIGDEPTKLTMAPKFYGYTGCELAEYLLEKGIVCEFFDPDYCVMMFSPELDETAFMRISDALLALERLKPIESAPPKPTSTKRAISVREAMMSPSEEIAVKDALGRVLADANVACPPAIPIAVCGEIIDENSVRAFEYYGVTHCRVVK